MSITATLFYLADFLFGRLWFGPVAALSVLLTGWASRDLIGRQVRPGPGRGPWPGLLITLGMLLYFLGPSLPDFLPLSARWDGANHLAIANFLKFHGSHRVLVAMDYSLSWGGDLKSYPWGVHVLLAAVSSISGINTLFLAHPLASVAASLVGGAWASSLMRQRKSALSVAASVVFITLAFAYLISLNYWAQIFGILILVALVHYLVSSPGKAGPLVPALLLGGITLVYPLLAPAAFVGFALYCVFARKLPIRQLAVSVLIAATISLLYVQPHLGANAARVIAGTGPGLWSPGFTITVFAAGCAVLAVRLVLERDHWALFPASLLGWIGALYLMNATRYWPEKSLYSGLFLLPPALAVIGDKVADVVSRLVTRRAVQCAAQALLVVGLYLLFPANFRERPPVAVTAREYRMLAWLPAHVGNKDVFLVQSAFKLSWFEAITYPFRIRMPPGMRDLAVQDRSRYRPGKLVGIFFTQAKQGDLIAIEWNPKALPAGVPMIDGPYWTPRYEVEGWVILERSGVPL